MSGSEGQEKKQGIINKLVSQDAETNEQTKERKEHEHSDKNPVAVRSFVHDNITQAISKEDPNPDQSEQKQESDQENQEKEEPAKADDAGAEGDDESERVGTKVEGKPKKIGCWQRLKNAFKRGQKNVEEAEEEAVQGPVPEEQK